MKKQNKKVTISVSRTLTEWISNDGTSLKLTKKELTKLVRDAMDTKIKEFNDQSKYIVERHDVAHSFNQFEVDDHALNSTYDENDKDTYAHFVHHFLRTYYSEKGHGKMGEDFYNYDPNSKLHERMISDKLTTYEYSIRNTILQHLVSSDPTGRGPGHPQHNKRLRSFKTNEQVKEFTNWILNTEMFKINDVITAPKKFSDDGYLVRACRNKTVGMALINWFLEMDKLELVEWLFQEHNLDLSNDVISDMSNAAIIVYRSHRGDIHYTYNNNVLRRKYTYERELRDDVEHTWETKEMFKFADIIDVLSKYNPTLKYKYDGETFRDAYHYTSEVILEHELSKSEKHGTRQSAEELLDLIEHHRTEEPIDIKDCMEHMIKTLG